jgi:hypothetical protein
MFHLVRPTTLLRSGMLAALLLCGPALQAAPATANCPGHCVSLSSIVHAAGVPPGVQQALDKISFDGTKLADGSKDVLAQLATEARSLPAKAVVKLSVAADSGLDPAAARRQASARAKSLSTGLKQAGLSAKQFKVSAAR